MIAILMAAGIAIVVSIAFTRVLIAFFARLGKGQPILGAEDRGPTHHMHKQGTPTMGGIAILLAAFIGWLVPHVRDGLAFSDQALIMWLAIVVLAAFEFLDDYLKVRRQHNRGIFWKKKGWITFGIVVLLMWLLLCTPRAPRPSSCTRPRSFVQRGGQQKGRARPWSCTGGALSARSPSPPCRRGWRLPALTKSNAGSVFCLQIGKSFCFTTLGSRSMHRHGG